MFLFIFSLHIYGPNYSPEMNMGYRVGEAVRTLALHQCGLIGLDSRSLPFAFVVSSCLAQKVFLRGSTVFFPPEKKSSNSNSIRIERDPHENQVRL